MNFRTLWFGGVIASGVLISFGAAYGADALPPLFPAGEKVENLPDLLDAIPAPGSYNAVTFSPDGRFLAAGSNNRFVQVWESSSGRALMALAGHRGWVKSVAYSPDGALLLSGATDKMVFVWDGISGQRIAELAGHRDTVTSVAFSPNGDLFASGSRDRTIRLWDGKTRQFLSELKGHDDEVLALAFSPDGQRLVSGGMDETVRLWDPESGQILNTWKPGSKGVNAVAFHPRGDLVAIGFRSGGITLWSLKSGMVVKTLEDKGDIHSVAFSPDGTHLVAGDSYQQVTLWDVSSGERLAIWKGHAETVRGVAFSPDGKGVASASRDQSVRVWDRATGALVHKLQRSRAYSFRALGITPDGRTIVTGAADNVLRLWDRNTGKPIRSLEGHQAIVRALAISPDGQTIVSGDEKGVIHQWDMGERFSQRRIQGHHHQVKALSYSPDGQHFVSSGFDANLLVWSRDQEVALRAIPQEDPPDVMVFSPDGRMLAAGGWTTTIRFWDVTSEQLTTTLKGQKDSITALSFSPDGQRLASGSEDKTIQVWDLSTGQSVFLLEGHWDTISAVAFAPDGRHLVSAGWDRALMVWDGASGKQLTSRRLSAPVRALVMDPQGGLLTLEEGGMITLWEGWPALKPVWSMLAEKDDQWFSCRHQDQTCFRHDDGHLLMKKILGERLLPLVPPWLGEPRPWEVYPPSEHVETMDQTPVPLTLRVRLNGVTPAHGVRLVHSQAWQKDSPLVFIPPAPLARMVPGEDTLIKGQLLTTSSIDHPRQGERHLLKLELVSDEGARQTVEVPVKANVPQLEMDEPPHWLSEKKVLQVKLKNTGAVVLRGAVLTLSSPFRSTRSQVLIEGVPPFGEAIRVEVPLPEALDYQRWVRYDLDVQQSVQPNHHWNFQWWGVQMSHASLNQADDALHLKASLGGFFDYLRIEFINFIIRSLRLLLSYV